MAGCLLKRVAQCGEVGLGYAAARTKPERDQKTLPLVEPKDRDHFFKNHGKTKKYGRLRDL
jgi:hypothetical protein